MTLNEISASDPIVSRSEALKEIKQHSACIQEFFEDCGYKDSYKAIDVLHWLGY